MVQAELEAAMFDQQKIGRGKDLGCLAHIVAVVFFQGHAVDEAAGEEDF